ncbi:MAG: ribbon-helix-helix protein, CopG family [Actinobacteria bacterium]|nr:ribbon-helix-helix protein, CopG family [Actinomycetota bacterium]
MAKQPLKVVSAQVGVDDAARLAELARAADRTVSAEVRRAVRAYVEREHQGHSSSARAEA